MGNRHRQARRGTDPGAGIRALRLELLFREELRSILEDELFDARFQGVRITLVELSRDGSRARVWYCMKHDNDPARVEETRAAFSRAAGYLRTRLCDALPLKRAPELSFRRDPAALFERDEEAL